MDLRLRAFDDRSAVTAPSNIPASIAPAYDVVPFRLGETFDAESVEGDVIAFQAAPLVPLRSHGDALGKQPRPTSSPPPPLVPPRRHDGALSTISEAPGLKQSLIAPSTNRRSATLTLPARSVARPRRPRWQQRSHSWHQSSELDLPAHSSSVRAVSSSFTFGDSGGGVGDCNTSLAMDFPRDDDSHGGYRRSGSSATHPPRQRQGVDSLPRNPSPIFDHSARSDVMVRHARCDSKGRCIHHPHQRLRRKKKSLLNSKERWEVLMRACPDCCMEEILRLTLEGKNNSEKGFNDSEEFNHSDHLNDSEDLKGSEKFRNSQQSESTQLMGLGFLDSQDLAGLHDDIDQAIDRKKELETLLEECCIDGSCDDSSNNSSTRKVLRDTSRRSRLEHQTEGYYDDGSCDSPRGVQDDINRQNKDSKNNSMPKKISPDAKQPSFRDGICDSPRLIQEHINRIITRNADDNNNTMPKKFSSDASRHFRLSSSLKLIKEKDQLGKLKSKCSQRFETEGKKFLSAPLNLVKEKGQFGKLKPKEKGWQAESRTGYEDSESLMESICRETREGRVPMNVKSICNNDIGTRGGEASRSREVQAPPLVSLYQFARSA